MSQLIGPQCFITNDLSMFSSPLRAVLSQLLLHWAAAFAMPCQHLQSKLAGGL